jgi:hypothetical protein
VNFVPFFFVYFVVKLKNIEVEHEGLKTKKPSQVNVMVLQKEPAEGLEPTTC